MIAALRGEKETPGHGRLSIRFASQDCCVLSLDLKPEFSACLLVFRHYTERARGGDSVLVASEDAPLTEDGRLQEAVTWATVISCWNARQRLDLGLL